MPFELGSAMKTCKQLQPDGRREDLKSKHQESPEACLQFVSVLEEYIFKNGTPKSYASELELRKAVRLSSESTKPLPVCSWLCAGLCGNCWVQRHFMEFLTQAHLLQRQAQELLPPSYNKALTVGQFCAACFSFLHLSTLLGGRS